VSSSGIYTSLKLKQARHKAQKVTQSTKHEEAKKPTGIKEGFVPNENSDVSSNEKISSILFFLYFTKKEKRPAECRCEKPELPALFLIMINGVIVQCQQSRELPRSGK
jgi:hypothetical protein